MGNKIDESLASLEKSYQTIRKILDANKIRDKDYFRNNSTEVIIMLLSVMERQYGHPIDYNKLQ